MRFERISSRDADLALLARFPDRLVFQTEEWIEFLRESQGAEPVFAELRSATGASGYFSGAIVRRFGLKILGSPFPGWSTPYMGFNLDPSVRRGEALRALDTFAFNELQCAHLELSDFHTTADEGLANGYNLRWLQTYESDLTHSEDQLFGKMTSACRRCIRKAAKEGLIIEECTEVARFSEEYYAQLLDVFAKQNLTPTYGSDRVSALLKHLLPTGRLLLLRALNPNDGRCVATGIYPGMGRSSYFWGNASFRSDLHLRPNEALHWHAMRYWKARGAVSHDWGGRGSYKEKYGCKPISIPCLFKSRSRLVAEGRRLAQAAYLARRKLGQLVLGMFNTRPVNQNKGVVNEAE